MRKLPRLCYRLLKYIPIFLLFYCHISFILASLQLTLRMSMATNGVNPNEETEMAECDGEKVVTMMDVLQEQEEFEEDANAVLGASDDKNCTYSKGYIKRQALYACLTCCPDAKTDVTKRAGVCLACSLNCHENHELVELYTKRNFCCDCGNPKFNSNPCQFTQDKTELNENNEYNQNFSGLYCACSRPYPDPDNSVDDEMIQCIICEDWLHANHLDAAVPPNDCYAEMICKSCMEKNEFLHDYSNLAVNVDNVDVDVTNGDITKESVEDADNSMAGIEINNVVSQANGGTEDEKTTEETAEKTTDTLNEEVPTPEIVPLETKTEAEIEKPAESLDAKPEESLDAKPEESSDAKPEESSDAKPEESSDAKPEEPTSESSEPLESVSESKEPDQDENKEGESTNTESTNEHKRKLSTDKPEENVKKAKLDTPGCKRPKGVTRIYNGATFWPSNLRQKLCTCGECVTMYTDLAVMFLIDPEDTVFAYESIGKDKVNGAPSQYEKGLQALSSLDRTQQINAMTEYNNLRDKLLDFLKSFKDKKEIVKEQDIREFFAGMKPKREVDGVYFCR